MEARIVELPGPVRGDSTVKQLEGVVNGGTTDGALESPTTAELLDIANAAALEAEKIET